MRSARSSSGWLLLALVAACAEPRAALQTTELAALGEGRWAAVWECDEGCDERAPIELTIRGDGGGVVAARMVDVVTMPTPADRLEVMFVVDASGDATALARSTQDALAPAFRTLTDAGARAGLVRVSTRASVLAAPTRALAELADATTGLYVRDGWHALHDGIRLANEAMGGSLAGVVAPARRTGTTAAVCAEATGHAIVAVVGGPDTNSADQNRPGDDPITRARDLAGLVVGAGRPALHLVLVDAADGGLEELVELAIASGGSAVAVASADGIAGAIAARVDALLHRTRRCATFEAPACPRFELAATTEGEEATLGVACGAR